MENKNEQLWKQQSKRSKNEITQSDKKERAHHQKSAKTKQMFCRKQAEGAFI